MMPAAPLAITGTFLDEISHDIPCANWGAQEWARDFAAMRAVGIDTVILIRCGYQNKATFDSKVLAREHAVLLVQEDLVGLFLTLAEQFGMAFYFGTYDSGRYWHSGQHQREIDLNCALTEEVWTRYGHSPAFKGWYICHEINTFDEGVMRVYEQLAHHLRGLAPLPMLISPYIRGIKQFEDAISLEQHEQEWEAVFSRVAGLVDIVAFQDGQVEFAALPDYLRLNRALALKYGLTCWSNVESFDRDMPIKFPPISWPKLRFKLEAAQQAGIDKLITFEFSHFLSPNSIYPAAHHLNRRYREWLEG
ncbi:DUF4434 domain-containing protein [Anthocerotibacter panamensis]|uniref:DUF4434 domain-containing protein n=1 Tax=Anthocerotibacter panamensis TaxID=2857077 RepID=UPI001C40699D|nr:DUF4434 domain-containing protein [Anthocerotibacter panamensis]